MPCSESDTHVSEPRVQYNVPAFTGRPGNDDLDTFECQLPRVFRIFRKTSDRDQVDLLCGTLIPYGSPAYEVVDSALPDDEKRTKAEVIQKLREHYDSAEI
jgi:hypothetical protein